ncbi:hypothetical protein MD484_g929, partial [Candolleomyces efflorescens]
MSSQHDGVPFTFLSSLFREISRTKPRSSSNTQYKTKQDGYPALQIFERWLNALHQKFDPLAEGTTAAVFRLIFPEEDTKRKYDMQETRLVDILATCHGLESRNFTQWDRLEGSGCLGQEVRTALEHVNSNDASYIGPLTITRVDELLSELAALSPFSDASIRDRFPKHTRRNRIEVIRNLYCAMSPEDASYLTQIILKDLRPLLYPLGEDYSVSPLTTFNTRAVTMLTKMDAMRVWDHTGSMLQASRVFSDMDRAAEIFEMPASQRPEMKPTVGVMVDIPKSKKGQSCKHTLNFLRSTRRVWAETKYDGERAQIHVSVPTGGGKPHITIFSKSKRDSTLDRHDVHSLIREALGFSGNSSTGRIKHSVILDAELVAFDGERVDEFWRIRRLVESTAYGVRAQRASRHKEQPDSQEGISQASMMSDDSDTRRLGLVFFDILSLESRNLIFTPYNDRRSILETIVRPKPGRVILARRFPIDMTVEEPELALCEIFAEHIADSEEGLVLKAEGSYYNDYKLPWVKLKKDYIPGYGDTVDMVLVGARWEKHRARELRVGPNIFTTFYFGAFKGNKKVGGEVPHIEVIFTASYGLNRKQLEDLNLLIRSSDSVKYPLAQGQSLEKYTFKMYAGLEPPSVLLQEPLLVELFGAGFTKPPQCLYYELRWPRMAKVFRARERSWKEGLDLRTLHDIACAAVGRDRSDKEIDDSVKAMFGIPVSPGARICLGRAIVYSDNGDPKTVLEALSLPKLAVPPPPSSVNIKFLLSPINPADINVIEGVYPSKPTKTDALTAQGKGSEGQPVFVGGNEGLAQVVAVGEGVRPEYLKEGDWVVVTKQQSGTWMTERNIPVVDVARVPDAERLTEAQAATLTVNPPTAYNMLHDFVRLKEGDWVIQNGANSAVGQAVIQIAAAKGLKTINLVRNRANFEELKSSLENLGATHVLTYDDLADKSVRDKIKGWTGGKDIRLGLNCVGGKETTLMARYLGKDAHLVSYGAMSKQPLSLPTSLFIFKNLTSHGFWQSQWYKTRSLEDRDALMKTLVGYIVDGKLDTPEIEVVKIGKDESDGSATEKIRGVMEALSEGRYGKKVLLKLD